MEKGPERAHDRPTSPVPGLPTAPRDSAGRSGNGVSSHHAVWWVVHYEGARDYAQSLRDAAHDVERTARPGRVTSHR